MAKYPQPGAVKTRLARVIGPDAAAALCHAFIRDLDERLRAAGLPIVWAYTPPDAPFGALVPGARLVAQPCGDLGARMLGIVRRLQVERPVPVVLLGADVPHLDPAWVRLAGAALAAGTEMVLGPAADGGYYLLGLRAPLPALFDGVRWGSAAVYADTETRARRLGIHPVVLPETFDVDEFADLARLAAVLESGAVTLPETAHLLETLRVR